MQLHERILTIGKSLHRLVRRLDDLGYEFYERAEAFPGSAPDTEAAIGRIEREIGELPAAIKLFWRLVGSVNFIGHHPDWSGCVYPDPVVVFPPVYALTELDDFLADKEERLARNFPYLVPIAPDPLHKQGVSGGMWYNLSVPAVADDPPLNDERHRISFVGYLELAVRWGGFPGLEHCPDHNYPLDAIRGDPLSET
jgi:hypothetical protein